jgi:microsomal prostaglandin-E synthase 2
MLYMFEKEVFSTPFYFLCYKQIPYTCVEVNPLTKTELKWSEYKKVPVVVLDGRDQINDSSAIISRLAAELQAHSSPKRSPPSKKGGKGSTLAGLFSGSTARDEAAASSEEEARWRRWVDQRLVRIITVNIYRTAKESLQTFDYITEHGNFGWAQREAARLGGASMMWAISGRLKKKYGVEGDVREALYSAGKEWVVAVGPGRRFMGGNDAPNLADLAVFGVLRAVVATDAYKDLMREVEGLKEWYKRMEGAVGGSSRVV